MSTFKFVEDMLQQLMQGSVNLSNERLPTTPQRWVECLQLYDNGWVQDGFDYVPNSYDIITYWKKEGEAEKKKVLLTFVEQQMWVKALTRRSE